MSNTHNTILLSEIIKLKGSQNLIIGHSGSGKTTLLKELIQQIEEPTTVYVFGQDSNEWTKAIDKSKCISFSADYPFSDPTLFTLKNCIVVFDDFSLQKKYEEKFYQFTNYNVRHFDITLFILCHSLFKGNLYSKILSSPSIFLTPSQSNLLLVQKYDKMFGTKYINILKSNITNTMERHILYLTSTFAVNCIENIFTPTATGIKMFKADKTFLLLDTDNFEIEEKNKEGIKSRLNEVLDDFRDLYPKRFKKLKKFIELVFLHLERTEQLSNQTLNIIIGGKELSLYDFIITSQIFNKKELDPKIKHVLQNLKKQNFKVPRFTLQNEQYRSYLT